MTAKVIQNFALEVHRDVRNGIPVAQAVESRLPAEVRAAFIEAMKTDLARGLFISPRDIVMEALRKEFTEMGLPRSWIDEALG